MATLWKIKNPLCTDKSSRPPIRSKSEAKIIIQFEQSYIVIANQTANQNFVSSEPILLHKKSPSQKQI